MSDDQSISLNARIDAYLEAHLPTWRDRPTCPGMWLSIRGQLATFATIKAFDDGSLSAYNPEGTRWYGPITPDPKGTE